MKRGFAALVLALTTCACGIPVSTNAGATATPPPPTPTSSVRPSGPAARSMSEADAQRAVGTLVRDTLAALKVRDSAKLAALAHPTKGVRFSPYPFLDPTNITLSAAQLSNAFNDPTKRTWGITDGKGDPITLTFAEYSRSFVYGRDFATSTQTAYNRTIGQGNATDNTAVIYPDAILFEAYDPGPDPQMKDTQWQSVRLLFERSGDRWYLVGVVHGEWTI